MALLVRIIKKNRWLPSSIVKDWTKTKDFPADPVTDLRTFENKLSMYRVKNKKDPLIQLIGLNFCNKGIEDLDYMLIDETVLIKNGLEVNTSIVNGKFIKVEEAHVDIENLTGKKLIVLAKLLYYRKAGSGIVTTFDMSHAFGWAVKNNEFKKQSDVDRLKGMFTSKQLQIN